MGYYVPCQSRGLCAKDGSAIMHPFPTIQTAASFSRLDHTKTCEDDSQHCTVLPAWRGAACFISTIIVRWHPTQRELTSLSPLPLKPCTHLPALYSNLVLSEMDLEGVRVCSMELLKGKGRVIASFVCFDSFFSHLCVLCEEFGGDCSPAFTLAMFVLTVAVAHVSIHQVYLFTLCLCV